MYLKTGESYHPSACALWIEVNERLWLYVLNDGRLGLTTYSLDSLKKAVTTSNDTWQAVT